MTGRTIVLAGLICCIFAGSLSAATYFVAPTGGSDRNPGTKGAPWATWQKAFNTVKNGDTVYFRGGTWYPTKTDIKLTSATTRGQKGTKERPICLFNYPGETPILDFSRHTNMHHTTKW